jgi:hypothetical protein
MPELRWVRKIHRIILIWALLPMVIAELHELEAAQFPACIALGQALYVITAVHQPSSSPSGYRAMTESLPIRPGSNETIRQLFRRNLTHTLLLTPTTMTRTSRLICSILAPGPLLDFK